jgi:ribosomal protein S18 acetylase RimI-like enzyme
MDSFHIRHATQDDCPALGRLGSMLMQVHHDLDRRRFIRPGENAEACYALFLSNELNDGDAVILVAERDSTLVAYIYASVEPQLQWQDARDRAAFVHDVFVDPQNRRSGIATALTRAALDWFVQRGVPRVTLWTSSSNDAAQTVFASLGFRKTMVEMTRELTWGEAPAD